MESRSSANSDDDGTYRFANLQPGTYYVSAGPDVSHRETLFNDPDMPRTGWPGMYYPQAPDMASAAPIRVTSGQKVQADMVMNRVPLYTVSGMVVGVRAWPGSQPSGAELLGRLRGRWSSLPPRDWRIRNSSACRELSPEGVFASWGAAASIAMFALPSRRT